MAKKRKIVVDGKEYNLDDFDDTRSWSRVKKKKTIKENSTSSSLPNILGRI
jgi:hypothetical protein